MDRLYAIIIFILIIMTGIGFYLRDKKIKQLKDKLDETSAHLDELKNFTFELYEHFKEHLGRFH